MSALAVSIVRGVSLAALVVSSASSQQTPKPEYLGFYAVDGGKVIAIADGKSDARAAL